MDTNVIYCGDNLQRLAHLPTDSVDLIYLDPPFFSNRHYEVIWGDEAEVRSFEDRWEGGITHYVDWMRDRVMEMRRVLKSTGSLYLHCDTHASHYLKVMLDDLFGLANFRSEIIWKRTSAHNSARRYGPVHDTILFYSKSDTYTWNPTYQPLPQETADAWYNNTDPLTGRRYNRADLTAANRRTGPSGMPWRGIDPGSKGRHWAIPGFVGDIVAGLDTLAALDALDAAGRIHWPKRAVGTPMVKRYLEEATGIPAQDVWTDIRPLHNLAQEREGFPTQKPETLLTRIILASSHAGDVVLDPFCGCGTSLVASDREHRLWVGIDISPTACNLMKRRLTRMGVSDIRLIGMPTTIADLAGLKPFEFQNWVIDRICGVQANRKSGDMGIDGWTFMIHDPVQIKQSEKIGRNVIDNFETAMQRANKTNGVIFAFSFGKGARDEVARAKQNHVTIELVTINDLLTNPTETLARLGFQQASFDPTLTPMPQFDRSRHTVEELVSQPALPMPPPKGDRPLKRIA